MFAAHNTFHSAPEYKVMSIIPRQMTTVYGLPEHGMVWPVGDGFRKLSRWTWTCRLHNILHYITLHHQMDSSAASWWISC